MSLDVYLSTGRVVSEVLEAILSRLRPYQWYMVDAAVACTGILTILRWLGSHQQLHNTQLRGPPSESLLHGVDKHIFEAWDSGSVYEAWARSYGPVYAIPTSLGSKRVILCDAKAIAHFSANDTWTYVQTPQSKKFHEISIGRGLLWADGVDHRRQRNSLNPAFTAGAIRSLTSVFYESAYKAKVAWDALIESSGGDSTLIEVQNWMNHISLDSIGLAAFSHNFGALEGKRGPITEVFDTFGASARSAHDTTFFLLAQVFPFLTKAPTSRTRLLQKLSRTLEEISNVLLARTQKEMEMGIVGDKGDKSIIGSLIKGASNDSEYRLTKDEVIAQMKVMLVAGYETTSISLTWTLIELSRNPNVQAKLRNELLEHGDDPTYDELTNGLPYLDAVVHEILRVHPPVPWVTRKAAKDDVIPLSEPVRTKSGSIIDSVTIAKGTLVTVSLQLMNRSATIWGEDAKVFRPSRWLEDASGKGIPAKAKEIQGHRHLLTFSDGPRICVGKNFAVTELKAVLTVLVKNFVFELRDGVSSKIEKGGGILPRPRIVGEAGCEVPLRVQPYTA